LQVWA